MNGRGQTSVEVLLVISFVLLLVLGIILPYVENQNITNAAIVAKLSILPFIERNSLRAKINSITPEVNGSDLTLHIRTTMNPDAYVFDELINDISPGCQRICQAVASLNSYSSVTLDWQSNTSAFCASPSGVPLTC